MSYYSDPTANTAIGFIDREINRMEKQAKALIRKRRAGKISEETWRMATRQYTGIFAGCLVRAEKAVIEEEKKEKEAKAKEEEANKKKKEEETEKEKVRKAS